MNKPKCKSNGKWYSFSPYETKCLVCDTYYPEDTTPECREFKEADYKITKAQWNLLDPANPAFMPADRTQWISWQKADYRIRRHEDAETYWARVRQEIEEKRNKRI